MINLNPINEDYFEFHKGVVYKKQHKKNDKDYKSRIIELDNNIKQLFKEYSNLISQKNLKSITPYGYSEQKKTDLLSLYRYKSKIFQDLKTLLTTKKGRKFNICQMCTVEPVKSFDHIIPKEKFPEYVVNPINLFPTCLTCNGHKGSRWLFDGERGFLNLYYDILPNVSYLKIEFKSYPIPIFSIDKSSLDNNFFNLLQSHYEELHLFKRFRENSNEIIDPLVSMAKSSVPKHGLQEFRNTVAESTKDMQIIYGVNHWKSLLKLAIVNHSQFQSLLNL